MDNLKASFEQDLISNAWRTSLLGTLSTLYFQEEGLVLVIPSALQKVETYMWSVIVEEGRALLSFISPNVEKEFMIAPTCNGISAMSNGKSSSMAISTAEDMTDVQLEFLRTQLTGTWFYKLDKSPKSHPSQFSIALNADGTFNLRVGPDNFHSVQDGIWRTSPDGQYLVLHTRVYIDQKEHYIAEAISLKSIDFEDMVIGAKSLPRALEAYGGKDLLFLSKARA
jgi:hypothetical protein